MQFCLGAIGIGAIPALQQQVQHTLQLVRPGLCLVEIRLQSTDILSLLFLRAYEVIVKV